MSEVVGAILMFGIVSLLFTTSLLGFVAAKEAAERRVVELQAESVAQRVAGVIVSASLFHEDHPGTTHDMEFNRTVTLFDQIEGHDYTLDTTNETVTVAVAPLDITVQASLLSANQTTGFTVCDQDAMQPGTLLLVRVSSTRPADCYWTGTDPPQLATDTKYVFVERRA